MSQINSEVRGILERIIEELSYLRKSINELRKESFSSKEYARSSNEEFYKEIVNNLIRSNVELHAKISELVVVINSLSKDLKELLNIFREAALLYMEGKKTSEPKNIEKKIEEIENVNKKLLEVLDKLYIELNNIKKEEEKREDKIIKRPLPPPPPIPIYSPKKM